VPGLGLVLLQLLVQLLLLLLLLLLVALAVAPPAAWQDDLTWQWQQH
jgi:hypothetical protein